MADQRNRKNIGLGLLDTSIAGGVIIGEPIKDSTIAPTVDKVDIKAIVTAMKGESVGAIADEAISLSTDAETETKVDHNGDTMLVVNNSTKKALKLVFMEFANGAVQKAINPKGSVEVKNGKMLIKGMGGDAPHVSIFMAFKHNGVSVFIFIPDAQATEFDDVELTREDAMQIGATFECLGDDSGAKYYIHVSGDTQQNLKAAVDDITVDEG